ncbi:MAG TPA: hypothetical protein VGQ20_15270, partial [Acidimicrobiales bacterium]|nr:hypothetical protein [Acidimicrobiales bacterium]
PRGITTTGVRGQYAHVVDVLPTLMAMIGLESLDQRDGASARPMAGTNFVRVIADPTAPSTHTRQHYESIGSRGYYQDGWEVVSLHQIGARFEDTAWELYNLNDDPTETNDLAAAHPAHVEELADAFDHAAWESHVYPLTDDFLLFAAARPPSDDALLQPLRLTPGQHTVDRYRSAKLIQNRSFSIDVELDFTSGDRGIVVSHGSLGGGYELSIENDELVWTHNANGTERQLRGGPIPPGTRHLTADVHTQPRGRWTIALRADEDILATADEFVAFVGMAPLEGIDVGRSRRSPVSWNRHRNHGPFAYRGTVRAVTYVAGDLAPDAPEAILLQRRQRLTTFD